MAVILARKRLPIGHGLAEANSCIYDSYRKEASESLRESEERYQPIKTIENIENPLNGKLTVLVLWMYAEINFHHFKAFTVNYLVNLESK